jgi:hypothetical protein
MNILLRTDVVIFPLKVHFELPVCAEAGGVERSYRKADLSGSQPAIRSVSMPMPSLDSRPGTKFRRPERGEQMLRKRLPGPPMMGIDEWRWPEAGKGPLRPKTESRSEKSRI